MFARSLGARVRCGELRPLLISSSSYAGGDWRISRRHGSRWDNPMINKLRREQVFCPCWRIRKGQRRLLDILIRGS
jgi:hypothetical protein